MLRRFDLLKRMEQYVIKGEDYDNYATVNRTYDHGTLLHNSF